MEQQHNPFDMLELMPNPAFLVKDQRITRINPAAGRLSVCVDTPIGDLLGSCAESYRDFTGGVLYLPVKLWEETWDASVIRMGDTDVFTLDNRIASPELRALALAARELRTPLSEAMLAARYLEKALASQQGQESEHLSRALCQLLRLVGNMSGASGSGMLIRKEVTNLSAFFREVMGKASSLAQKAGVTLTWDCPEEEIDTLADSQLLERALLNLISNAMKFTPKNEAIHARLSRKGSQLLLQVCDKGTGISEDRLYNAFLQYQREPGLEDSRHGIGLGLQLVRTAAASHNGSVLIDRPAGWSTRVTMTIPIDTEVSLLRTEQLHMDYAGEWDHSLIELSGSLPAEVFANF